SCNSSISDSDLQKLNGYWEIETAVLPDGTEKEYTINSTVDYFELQGKKGFRKKVMPQLDGTYLMNNVMENISIAEEDGKTYINYTTLYAKWKEQILKLDSDELVIKNAHGLEYRYKKPQPFSVK
ncbi:MAG: hypothetical protein EOO45_31675, partial [Flavobacterium sp.]